MSSTSARRFVILWIAAHLFCALATRRDAQSCASEALEFSQIRDKHGDFAPGAGRHVPVIVGKTLRTLQFHSKIAHRIGAVVLFDIGANKGRYSAALFDATCDTIPRREAAAEKRDELMLDRTPPANLLSTNNAGCPTIFAVEADSALCRSVLAHIADIHGFPSAQYHVINAAMFSSDGEMRFAAETRTGSETGSLVKPGMSGAKLERKKRDETARTWCIGSLITNHGIARAHWIKVDVEGYDPYVLHGAEQTLRRRAISGVMFEYAGTWERVNATHTLRHVVSWLDGLKYNSYLVGRTRLIALSGRQWHDAYESREWADVIALAAGSDFERTFVRSYGRPLPCVHALRCRRWRRRGFWRRKSLVSREVSGEISRVRACARMVSRMTTRWTAAVDVELIR